ncbi:MAG: nucleotidyltransferase family protein [Anaerolineae bacterium]|nr:nucleotidyltransferase family protein [Anaerolineae bacterium]
MTDQVYSKPTLEELRQKRVEILQLAEQHDAYNVRVFGSLARGEASAESDIDLLVSVRPHTSIFDLVGLWLELKDLLGCEVDLSTDEGLKDYVRPQVLKDAVPL